MTKRTKDDNKKAFDNQAHHEEKNELKEKNRKLGRHQYSKKSDHL
ncbi:DUF3941 domain-containing protein [Thalassobacillus hwangdonensis]|uniref:DUF3941 domain-containing protein n=1 Tax=Thalassobacillus hwangdonensis TaxID=546108 RepID=A0ABW3KY68_9BACI